MLAYVAFDVQGMLHTPHPSEMPRVFTSGFDVRLICRRHRGHHPCSLAAASPGDLQSAGQSDAECTAKGWQSLVCRPDRPAVGHDLHLHRPPGRSQSIRAGMKQGHSGRQFIVWCGQMHQGACALRACMLPTSKWCKCTCYYVSRH